jgi:Fuc2NAc and GlcNAc transferase
MPVIVRNEAVVFLLAFVVSWSATKLLVHFLISRNILDVPNGRSSHGMPTPRGGGVGILLGLAVALTAAKMLNLPVVSLKILLATLAVAVGGALDDVRRGIPALVRLAIQGAAAYSIVGVGGGLERLPLPAPLDIQLYGWGVLLATVWIVAVCNFFNFLDGIDGYAGTQAALAGLGFCIFGNATLMATSLALIGACLGFLILNWHPARVFMGDVGSGALGFLLASLPFALPAGPRETSVFAVGLFLWFFLSDGLFTLLIRLARGERVWTAHRTHLYQRLVLAGMSHDSVVVRLGSVGLLLTLLTAMGCRFHNNTLQWASLLLAGLTCLAYVVWTRSFETRSHRGAERLAVSGK